MPRGSSDACGDPISEKKKTTKTTAQNKNRVNVNLKIKTTKGLSGGSISPPPPKKRHTVPRAEKTVAWYSSGLGRRVLVSTVSVGDVRTLISRKGDMTWNYYEQEKGEYINDRGEPFVAEIAIKYVCVGGGGKIGKIMKSTLLASNM